MSQAIETLMHEHRVIEQVLASMETFAARLEAEADPRATLRDYARFLRGFADRCHHAKEEDRLFVEMVRHGFPREQGPIAVMLADHVESRGHVAALARAGEETGPLTDGEAASVRIHVDAYVSLLRSHIMKEDNVLYPMATSILSSGDMNRLAQEFDEHERLEMGSGTHEELHRLAERLIEAYPPAETSGADACGMGCFAHARGEER